MLVAADPCCDGLQVLALRVEAGDLVTTQEASKTGRFEACVIPSADTDARVDVRRVDGLP